MADHIHPLILIVLVFAVSSARELRPSEHGLGSQIDPPSATAQMQSFFAAAAPPDESFLPKPVDSGDDADWWKSSGSASEPRRHGRGTEKSILFITSIVCGIAGVALLVTAALVFAFRSRINANPRPPSAQLVAK